MCEYRDIEYRRVGETSLKLDIYQPKGLARDTAALIFIHGGSWRGGDRQDYLRYLVDLAEAGYITVTVSYRFAQEAVFPLPCTMCGAPLPGFGNMQTST